jgi:hypothetical protein
MMTKKRSHLADSTAGYIYSWAAMIVVVSVCLFIVVTGDTTAFPSCPRTLS